MFFGIYGGMMRGGNTDSTVVVADGPIEAPPVVSHAWAAIAMHDEFWAPLEPKLRPGGVVLVNDSTFPTRDRRARHGASASAPRSSPTELGNPLGGVDGHGRRATRRSPGSSGSTRWSRGCGSRSPRTARSTSRERAGDPRRLRPRHAERGSRVGAPSAGAHDERRPPSSRRAAPSPSTPSTARDATSASPRARRRCSRCRKASTGWAITTPSCTRAARAARRA